MKERPILFSGPMVRAILAGTKTQTRRMVRPGVLADGWPDVPPLAIAYAAERCPYGVPGDRLWVRETFAGDDCCGYVYRADHENADLRAGDLDDGEQSIRRWSPSIHMPRAASRLDLEISAVRVERLQDISEADAQAEGVEPFFTRFSGIGREQRITSGELAADAERRASFAVLWDEINGDRALWISNPWVWALSFEVTQ